MKNNKSAFTIVELLIVIVVIGILAAIVIVAYNGVQTRARDSQRKSDVANIVKGMQRWTIDNGKTFEEMNLGWTGVSATGWFSSAYADVSVKNVLINGDYLPSGFGDPLAGRDYMLTRCTTSTDNRRVILARLENPHSQTVTEQLAGSGCNHSSIATFSTGSYMMNYAVVVGGS